MNDPYVVLDVDDTLVDTYRTGYRKCAETARRLGIEPPSPHDFGAVYGRWSFDECVRRLHPGVDVDAYRRTYDSLAAEFPPVPLCDVPALAHAARTAGFRVGIFTNGPGDKTERKLRAVGVDAGALDFVRHACNTRHRKPAGFADLRDALPAPERSWYVSDSPVDWAGADAHGMSSIGVTSAVPANRPLPGCLPQLVVPSAGALAALLPRLAELPPERERPETCRAVCFDVGFTLVDNRTEPDVLIAEWLTDNGHRVGAHAVRRAMDANEHLLADTGAWRGDATIHAMLSRFYGDVLALLGVSDHGVTTAIVDAYTRPDAWVARPAAAQALGSLRADGIPVGVFSNWQSSLPETLAATGLASLIDVVAASATVGFAKPATSGFRSVASALGVHTTEMAHVGDDPDADAFGALTAGCRAAYVPPGEGSELLDVVSVFAAAVQREPRHRAMV